MGNSSLVMDWRALLDPEIQAFMKAHAYDDVSALALKKSPDASWPYSLILNQIKVRQKAHKKTPKYSETDRFVFPNNNVFEQASSFACSSYKSQIIKGKSFIDLTGGCGIDTFSFALKFEHGIVVERDDVCAEILAHNAKVLNLNLDVVHGDAEAFIDAMGHCDLVYIDPQRRDDKRKGKYDLSTCSPNIIEMLPVLKKKACRVIVKTSPFLDIDKTILDLCCVVAVYIVQYQGDCKEVLYVLDPNSKTLSDDVQTHAVTIDDDGKMISGLSFMRGQEKAAIAEYGMPEKYIYEPGPACQKAGGFKIIGERYGLKKLHAHTHLYTSTERLDDFPGKIYEILDVVPAKADRISISRADLTIRNFPSTVEILRKKLKLSDGGAHRIFATTLKNNEKKLIICIKS